MISIEKCLKENYCNSCGTINNDVKKIAIKNDIGAGGINIHLCDKCILNLLKILMK